MPLADSPQSTIGRFRIEALLGAERTGRVYRAHDPDLGRDVALKVLDGTAHGDSVVIAEAVGAIYDAGIADGAIYLAIDTDGTPDSTLVDELRVIAQVADLSTFGTLLLEVPARHPELTPRESASLERIAARCLAEDPVDRYDSPEEALYDLRRVVKTLTSAAAQQQHRLDPRLISALAVIALLVAIVIVTRLSTTSHAPTAPVATVVPAPPPEPVSESHDDDVVPDSERKMIAVLPFENLGPAADAYFADGMTEEITNRLAAVRGLGVISRTSVTQYAKRQHSAREIGDALGVHFILDGTVRWEHVRGGASRVRVSPKLIRVADQTLLWSAQYDRLMQDIFKVQSEIATRVIHALNIKLRSGEEQLMSSALTASLPAYESYLHGLDASGRSHSERDARDAVKWLQRAVELDPDFASAWARLGMAHAYLYHVGFDRSAERLARSQEAVDRAAALDTELPLTHLALGYFHYWGHRDYARASGEFALAWKGLPNSAEVIKAIGFVRRRQGDFAAAAEDLARAQLLDPQNARLLLDLGHTYLALRRFEEAAATYDRILTFAPEHVLALAGRIETEWLATGSAERAAPLVARLPRGDDESSVGIRFKQALYERDFDRAARLIEGSRIEAFLLFHIEQGYVPRELLLGQAYALRGDKKKSDARYAAVARRLESELEKLPDDARRHAALGLAYAALGRAEEAVAAGRRAVELQPVASDALGGPERLLDLAKIYAAVGEREEAIDQLRALLELPSLVSARILTLDPSWDSLRDEPRFKELVR